MSYRREKLFVTVRVILDTVMILLAWFAAYFLRFHSGLEVTQGVPPRVLYFKLMPFIAVIWLAIFYLAGIYRRSGRHRSAFVEGLDIIQCSVIAIFAFIAFTYFYEEYRYSRITILIFACMQPVFVIAGRSLMRKTLRFYGRQMPTRNVLLIGSGETLRHAWKLTQDKSIEPVNVLGAILVGQEGERAADVAFLKLKDVSQLENPTDWPHFFTEKPTQAVYFALPHGAYNYLESEMPKIADQVYDIKIVPDIFRYTRFSAGIEYRKGVPLININESPLSGAGGIVKRLMDIAGSFCGLILLSPVMVTVALIIPRSSRGPILYRQTRMGLDGRPFACLKFRSMPMDAEQSTGAVWATSNDTRPTKFGRFLRRTSIDELPQLFNVLKGDMSLVGPRPERPIFVNQFRKQIPGYMLRHKVKAGMTGWAQVNGWRGNTSIEKRIECDLFYIQNWSLWLDIKILIKTVEEVLFGRNAY